MQRSKLLDPHHGVPEARGAREPVDVLVGSLVTHQCGERPWRLRPQAEDRRGKSREREDGHDPRGDIARTSDGAAMRHKDLCHSPS